MLDKESWDEPMGTLCSDLGNKDGEGSRVRTEEDDLEFDLHRVHKLVFNILKTPVPIGLVRQTPGLTQTIGLSTRMRKALRLDFELVKRHFPAHRLSPELQLLERSTIKWTERGTLPCEFYFKGPNEHVLSDALLNNLARDLQREASSEPFLSERKAYRGTFMKNHRGFLRNVEHIRAKWARMLAIRIDLSYRKPGQWPGDTRSPVTYDEVKMHRRDIFRWIKRRFAVLGYAWRLEYGQLKGYHYHVLLLLDGSRHQRGISIGQQIGGCWSTVVTSGKGLYWNCNAHWYPWNGIGMLDHRDSAKTKIFFERVVPYLTKTEAVLKFTPDDGSRTFGQSVTRKAQKQSRGRPRATEGT